MTRLPMIACTVTGLALLACGDLPGKPTEADRFVHPQEIVDFDTLYGLHCSGCHGEEGRLGPAQALNDPVYLAYAPDEVMVSIVRDGVAGTSMPAFGIERGGPLTAAQVEALVGGLRERWRGTPPDDVPPYRATASAEPVDEREGARVFEQFCGRCHGAHGRGTSQAGAVVDTTYLSLRSDQGLRTTVVVGRPDLEMPDWRSHSRHGAMTEPEIDTVVAWMISKRSAYPGQPYPDDAPANAARADGGMR